MRRFSALQTPHCLPALYEACPKTLNYVEGGHVRESVGSYARRLKECIRLKLLSEGERIHNRIIADGLSSSTFLGNLLITLYGKCGRIDAAREVFDRMADRSVVTWTAMIGFYSRRGHGDAALRLFERMQRRGVNPNKVTLLNILNAFCSPLSLKEGRRIHRLIVKLGLASDAFLGAALVGMYSRCGDLNASREVFENMTQKDGVLWNAIIAAYGRVGDCEAAFSMFYQMQAAGVKESKLTYVTLLKACGLKPSLSYGKLIHDRVCDSEFVDNVMVNNALVNMYSQCRSLKNARQVFEGMKERDMVTWNTMAGAYAQHATAKETLGFVNVMKQRGLKLDRVTWLSVLDAFCSPESLEMGKIIHRWIVENGDAQDVVVANAIMKMYAKCGNLESVRIVFEDMIVRDLISWNILIQAYVKLGRREESLELFEQMQQQGFKPNKSTFLSCLNACASPAELAKGRQFHALILAHGLELDIILGTALLSMYGHCGSTAEAHEVFKNLSMRDVIPWTAMITAYAENNCRELAMELFKKMVEEDILPNNVTFVSILNACDRPEALADGRKIHSVVSDHRLEADLYVSTALVKMYALCGSLEDACRVFSNLTGKDVIAWNTMMSAYAQYGFHEQSLKLFNQMQQEGVKPNKLTYVSTLKACSKLTLIEDGERIHACIIRIGLHCNPLIQNTLIDMYSKCGSLEKALQIFDTMKRTDVVAWNTLIAAYAQHGCGNKALSLFTEMEHWGAIPDEYTLVSILAACANLGLLAEGKTIHAHAVNHGCDTSLVVGNAVVDMYGKCGRVEDAWLAFIKMVHRNTISCNTMIATYAIHGFGNLALRVFGLMQWLEIQPDNITYTNVLLACSHAGLIEEGSHYLSVAEACPVELRTEHYGCMVDLLARAKTLNEAECLVG